MKPINVSKILTILMASCVIGIYFQFPYTDVVVQPLGWINSGLVFFGTFVLILTSLTLFASSDVIKITKVKPVGYAPNIPYAILSVLTTTVAAYQTKEFAPNLSQSLFWAAGCQITSSILADIMIRKVRKWSV